VIVLLVLLLLALIFGIGAVIKGALWLVFVAILLIVIFVAATIGTLRKRRS
jgi:hypothetical protein